MKLPTVRTRDVYEWEPCWDKEKLEAFLEKVGDRSWAALDVLDPEQLPEVSALDRLWLVLRPEMLPPGILQRFARECADRAARVHLPVAFRRAADLHPDATHAAKLRRHAAECEKGQGDLGSAGDAARAARDAAGAAGAAGDAARDARDARDAARDAEDARDAEAAGWAARADMAAAWAAWDARDAAWDARAARAARDAERQWQVARLRVMLEKEEAR